MIRPVLVFLAAFHVVNTTAAVSSFNHSDSGGTAGGSGDPGPTGISSGYLVLPPLTKLYHGSIFPNFREQPPTSYRDCGAGVTYWRQSNSPFKPSGIPGPGPVWFSRYSLTNENMISLAAPLKKSMNMNKEVGRGHGVIYEHSYEVTNNRQQHGEDHAEQEQGLKLMVFDRRDDAFEYYVTELGGDRIVDHSRASNGHIAKKFCEAHHHQHREHIVLLEDELYRRAQGGGFLHIHLDGFLHRAALSSSKEVAVGKGTFNYFDGYVIKHDQVLQQEEILLCNPDDGSTLQKQAVKTYAWVNLDANLASSKYIGTMGSLYLQKDKSLSGEDAFFSLQHVVPPEGFNDMEKDDRFRWMIDEKIVFADTTLLFEWPPVGATAEDAWKNTLLIRSRFSWEEDLYFGGGDFEKPYPTLEPRFAQMGQCMARSWGGSSGYAKLVQGAYKVLSEDIELQKSVESIIREHQLL